MGKEIKLNTDRVLQVEVSTNPVERQQKNYDNRHKVWSTKALEHLGNTTNLITTLSVAFLGFLFSQRKEASNHKIFFLVIVVLCYFSIFFGLLSIISRLYDFKITRNIISIRKAYFKKHSKKLPRAQKGENNFIHSLCIVLHVLFYGVNSLYNESENLSVSFIELSKLANSLGNTTWRFFNFQIIFFFISIVLYSIFYIMIT